MITRKRGTRTGGLSLWQSIDTSYACIFTYFGLLVSWRVWQLQACTRLPFSAGNKDLTKVTNGVATLQDCICKAWPCQYSGTIGFWKVKMWPAFCLIFLTVVCPVSLPSWHLDNSWLSEPRSPCKSFGATASWTSAYCPSSLTSSDNIMIPKKGRAQFSLFFNSTFHTNIFCMHRLLYKLKHINICRIVRIL